MSALTTLANGVRIYADPMASLETVALGVWTHAGSVDERPEEHGIAHLLEHMAFKGTGRRSARQIAEEIESVGGFINAATSQQRTGYYVRLLKDDIELGLDILADILQNPVFNGEELTKEQDVIVQEIGEAADLPDDVVFELLQAASWEGHALARPILGTPETVRAQTPDSLRGFMRRCYRPDEIIVAAAGAVDADGFAAMVERQFSAVAKCGAGDPKPAPNFKGGVRHDARDIEQTHLALAFPGVSARHEDFFATRIFADILGGGMSSRLFQIIREERGLAYSVYAFADGYEQCGLTGAFVAADDVQMAQAAQLIRAEIEDLAENPTQEELDRARAMLRASLMMSLENPSSRIDAAAGQLFTFGRTLATEEILTRLAAVSLGDVKRCAKRALSGPFSAAMVGPGEIADVEQTVRG